MPAAIATLALAAVVALGVASANVLVYLFGDTDA